MVEKDVTKAAAELAWINYRKTCEIGTRIQGGFLELAMLLKQNRDLSLYKFLGHDSFEEFLGAPEISFSRAKAYQLIRQYELFVEKLGRSQDELREIGTSKLTIIAPVVLSNPDEWLSKAKTLSKSDLRIEAAAARGTPPKSSLPSGATPGLLGSPSASSFTCFLCGSEVNGQVFALCADCANRVKVKT